MKKKQGFTLIELLAVIVILAIIALITTPTILDIVEKAKINTAENSAYGYLHAIEIKNIENMLGGENNLKTGTYDITDIQVNYKGKSPSKGYLTIGKDRIEKASLCINDYYITYDGKISKVEKSKQCDDIINDGYFIFDKETGIIQGYSTDGLKDVVIPKLIDGIKVIGIGENAFSEKGLTSLIIPNGIVTIGNRAFNRNKLENVTIPSSVISIGNAAFSNNKLTSLIMSDGLINIGKATFQWNQLTNVIIPNSVTEIGQYAFDSNQLKNLIIPNSVTSIGSAVANNNKLLDNQAFIYNRNSDGSEDKTVIVSYGGAKKNDVSIPTGIIKIGIAAFTSNELSSITIPNTVINIEETAFSNNKLTSIIIPNSVTSIGHSAFYNNQLNNLTISNSTVTIGNYAFSTNKLTNIILPNSVTSIGKSAFSSNQLTNVKVIGKINTNEFVSYPSISPWGWAIGYNDSNITWNAIE